MNAIGGPHNPLLEKMRSMASEAKHAAPMNRMAPSEVSGFDKIYNQAVGGLKSVNDLQVGSEKIAERFALGDPNISITQLKVAEQKADLAFKFTSGVRNKFIDAYHDVWNMSV